MDADEADLVRRETIENLFADLYAAGAKNRLAAGFRRLVDAYGMGRDERIADMVLNLYAFVQSLANPTAWFQAAREHVAHHDGGEGLPPVVDALRRDVLLDRITMLEEAAALEAKIVRSLYSPAGSVADQIDELAERLGEWRKSLREATDPDDVDRVVCAIAGYKPERAPSQKGLSQQAKQELEAARKLRDAVRKRVESRLLRPAGVFRSAAILDGLSRIGPHVASLVDLTQAFGRRYERVKQSEGRLDFGDLERRALELLSANEQGDAPSEVALRLQAEFEHVLVDEFQDVNPVQNAILNLVSRPSDLKEGGNLFAVGDVKQSIYRFRLAEPDLFVHRIRDYETPDATDGRTGPRRRGRVVWLQENFRSRKEILEAVNAVFERLMVPQLAGLAYDEHACLKPGASYPEVDDGGFGRPAVELHLIEENLEQEPDEQDDRAENSADENTASDETAGQDGTESYEAIEREAMLVGRRILELTGRDGEHPATIIFDRREAPDAPALVPRPIAFRDIVLLLRATRGKANHFERILREMGIPVYAEMSTGYFASLEIQDVLSLLSLIDNAQQDIPLAAVLRSPLMREPLTEDQMVEIRLFTPDAAFHRAVRRYAESGPDEALRKRLRALEAQLDDWRDRLRRQPLPDVLWQILAETGYWAYVGGLRNGVQRRANLIRLHDRARQFNTFARQGLGRFLRFLKQLDREERDPGIAAAVSEAEDVVRIMSVHRSKGLEFPVVILADLGKCFNLADVQRVMLFDRRRFIGLPVVDLEWGVRYPTLSSLAVADEIARQTRAEEMRILYVAMTRAREHLILVGTTPLNVLKHFRQRGRVQPGRVPLIDLMGAKTALEWVLPALASMSDTQVHWSEEPRPEKSTRSLFTVHQHDAAAVKSWALDERQDAPASSWMRRFAELAPVADADPSDPEVRDVIHRLTHPYPYGAFGAVPAVVAASEIKRRFAPDHEPDEHRPAMPFAASPMRRPRLGIRPQGLLRAPTPAEQGTLMHLVLQHLDLNRPCDVRDIARQTDEMVARGLLTAEERGSLAFEPLAWFLNTELGRRLRQAAERVRREVPFVLGVPANRLVPGTPGGDPCEQTVLVRGMIDCLLMDDRGYEVIDFKTDTVERDALAERAALYKPQMDIYTEAVRRIWRRPVSHARLVFLRLMEIVEV